MAARLAIAGGTEKVPPVSILGKESMALTDKAKAMLEIVHRPDKPRFFDLSVEQGRRAFDKMAQIFSVPRNADDTVVQDILIPRADDTALHACLYLPKPLPTPSALPLVIYYHGGGWCVGNVTSYDGFCSALAVESGCAVLAVDYRLAPECPFPHGLEDARLAYDWARDNASRYRLSPERIALVGDSAGGTFSLVTALTIRDNGVRPPLFLCAIYPCTQIHSERPSRRRYGEGHFLDNGSMEWFFSRYLPDGNADDWRASPMNAASLAELPPMLLITADYDPLSDDGAAFADRVRAEGGEVRHLTVPGMIHGFLPFDKFFPESLAIRRQIAAALKQALAP